MRWTPEDFAQAIGAFRREWAGAIRRMTIGAVPGSIWQMLGHVLFDAAGRESREVEVFSGIGFFARPAGGGTAEAIVVEVGGANGPAVIATRDEATRAKVDDIAADEVAMYNTPVRVYLKADGTAEIRLHSGAAVALALKSDVQNVVTAYNAHTHSSAVGPPGVAEAASNPTGTSVLKAE